MIAFKYQFEDDCRRRALESIDYGVLVAHVKDSFPFFTEQTYRLMYVDEEDSWITVSSQDDLEEAVRVAQAKQKILNFVLKPRTQTSEVRPSATNNTAEVSNAIHPNIFCDGCGQHVRGIRYKCTICDDFDLCSSCEAQQVFVDPHEGSHPLLKIIKPLQTCLFSSSILNESVSDSVTESSTPLVRLTPATKASEVSLESDSCFNESNLEELQQSTPFPEPVSGTITEPITGSVTESQLDESMVENLRVLKEAGFLNESLNVQLLSENSNDLNSALDKLLNASLTY